ncbi:hypothetical protein Tco_0002216 [Tanacetum coccineum]
MVRGNRLGMRKQRRLAREARRLVRKALWSAQAPNQSLASSRRPRGSSWLVDRECSSCHLAGPRIGYPEALIANHLWRLVGKKTEIPLNCWALNWHQLSFVKGFDLVGDEVISTTLDRENDKFIKFVLRKFVLSQGSQKEYFDINSPLGEQVVDFLMENVDVAGLPRHLVKDDIVDIALTFRRAFRHPSNVDREIDCNPQSSETIDLFEELITEIGLDDSIPIGIDDTGITKSVVLPLPDPRQICLREVERFDPFFSLTQSGAE